MAGTVVGFINTSSVLSMVIGALVLGLIAVVLDRINFPQRPFRPKQIRTGSGGPSRDRTGAHIVDVDD